MDKYPEINFAIKNKFKMLVRDKLTPWRFLNAGNMIPVEDFYGRTIQYRGVAFKGSPRQFFWGGFVEPFLEAIFIWAFEFAVEYAEKRKHDCQEVMLHSYQYLTNGLYSTYITMRDIDRKLRGKGFPSQVPPRDISRDIKRMQIRLDKYRDSALLAVDSNKLTEKKRLAATELSPSGGARMNTKSLETWDKIQNNYDVTKRGFGKKINFIKDPFKRKIIFRDIEQAYILANSGFSKPAVILAGSIIEEFLRIYLVHKGVTPANNTFDGYIQACKDNRLLKRAIYRLTDAVRHFRNLVHLEQEASSRATISKATAIGAVSSIFTIVNDL
jgi:hypothetical protein